MYYTSLGHRVYEYLDRRDEAFSLERDESEFDVFHFPTWQMKQLPSGYFDMICCVQVLREISVDVLLSVLETFARVLRPGGALYIRDHVLFHNSNGLPQEELLIAHGFHLEYFPRVRDGAEVHGIPRIWRKFDQAFYG
jgi:SAM-dependent methyltransferase